MANPWRDPYRYYPQEFSDRHLSGLQRQILEFLELYGYPPEFANLFSANPKPKSNPEIKLISTKITEEKDNTQMAQIPTMTAAQQAEQEEKLKSMSIVRQGTKLIVPEGVELSTAIKALDLKQREEEQEVSVSHILPIEVAEGMVGFLRVLEREYGFVTNTGSQSFFGTNPPTYMAIETSPGKRESIPDGRLQIPGITGYLTPTYSLQNNSVVFMVKGVVKGKDRHKVDKIMAMVEEECKNNSIYKGHAIMTSFLNVEDCSSFQDTFPVFAKLNKISPEQVIFSKATEDQINFSLFTPIKRTEACRKNNIPLKRGILLEGPYGTGKTLTAAATATLCAENGWTFIYLKDVTRLAQAYSFAAQYQPAVIFAEDIDQILTKEDRRDDKVNDILNALDGIDSKGIEVMTVLTTNHLEKITKAMLRPGRLDTVVSVCPPDKAAAIRLIRMYAGDLMMQDADLDEAGNLLAGEIPAIIREVVERSKLAALRRESDDITLTPNDVEVTARSMKAHMALLKPTEPDVRSEREKAAQIIADGTIKAASVTIHSSKFENEEHNKQFSMSKTKKPKTISTQE